MHRIVCLEGKGGQGQSLRGARQSPLGFHHECFPGLPAPPVYPPLPAKDSRLVIALAAAKQSCSKRLTHAFQSQKILSEYFPAPSSALGIHRKRAVAAGGGEPGYLHSGMAKAGTPTGEGGPQPPCASLMTRAEVR